MKIIQEQIKVMQHYANGGEVEHRQRSFNNNNMWELMTEIKEMQFNFADFDYRIKKQKKTIIIEKWLVQFDDEEYRIMHSSDIDKSTATKIKLLETYEVEL